MSGPNKHRVVYLPVSDQQPFLRNNTEYTQTVKNETTYAKLKRYQVSPFLRFFLYFTYKKNL